MNALDEAKLPLNVGNNSLVFGKYAFENYCSSVHNKDYNSHALSAFSPFSQTIFRHRLGWLVLGCI